MTRIVSKFGIAAALTLGVFSTAAAQVRKPTTTIPVTKEATSPGEVITVHDTVRMYLHDTTKVYLRDTVRLTGPTVTRWDTVSIERLPGWMDKGNGLYFGLGAGSYTPSGGLGGGQIPGYAFQANLGLDPAGSPLGIRLTTGVARPDEDQATGGLGGRPTVMNTTADLKLRLPIFRGRTFPMFSLYGVGGGALTMFKDLRQNAEVAPHTTTLEDHNWHHAFGYNVGGGATLQIGHQREIFLEGRLIAFKDDTFQGAHQTPIILGVNWY